MKCEDARQFVDAYVDGEFGERERAEFDVHIEACEPCRQEVEGRIELKDVIKKTCRCGAAPDELRARIMGELRVVSAQETRAGSRRKMVHYVAAAVPLAGAIAVVLAVVTPEWFAVDESAASEQLQRLPAVQHTVEWHRGDFPVEVTGPATEAVTGWFRGKVDFPVRLPAFDAEQVQLVGGRIAHVDDKRAAYALYDVGGARLSVMMSHDDKVAVPAADIERIEGRDVAFLNLRGYEVAILRNNGITYTMTSDLSHPEMVDLVQAALHR